MKVLPLYDRVLLEVIPDTETKIGNLFVPMASHRKSPMGRAKVLACGQGCTLAGGQFREMTVKVGDIVWYSKERAEPIPHHGYPQAGAVVMVVEESILAILSELDTVSSLVGPDQNPLLIPANSNGSETLQ